jgi:uncharacterized SAM-binding protein YcdF (DUF218 family)
MFFILSKVLVFLIKPLNWVIALMLYSLFSKKQKRKRQSLIWAITLTLFFSNQLIFNEVIRLWEPKTIRMDQIEESYDIGILLGGYSSSNIIPSEDRHNFNEAGNRFFNAFELYKSGKVKKLLLTGGSGRIMNNEWNEADEMAIFFKKIGIPREDFMIESESRNTHENAVFTAKLLSRKYPNSRCLLITSASHMPRSIGCFSKQKVDFIPFCVNYLSEKRRLSPEYWLLPNRLGFYKWEILIKEWVGYLVYWVRGYV